MTVYEKVVRFIKDNVYFELPVSIRRVKMSDDLQGECEVKNNKFYVRINKNLAGSHSIDVLLHEVAHAMSWGTEPDQHGPKWGKSYSKLYRMFEKEFLETEEQN